MTDFKVGMLQLLQGFLLLIYFHFLPWSTGEWTHGRGPGQGTTRGLHLYCCCELVRTKEQRSTFGTFIPPLETETMVLETMTFSEDSLEGSESQHSCKPFPQVGHWFLSGRCIGFWKSLALSPSASTLSNKRVKNKQTKKKTDFGFYKSVLG